MIKPDIDVTKLDKARFREGKAGQKYCDLILFDKPNERSDGFVKQGVTKEEREAGVQLPIIGNWKRLDTGFPRAKFVTQPQPDAPREDGIPF